MARPVHVAVGVVINAIGEVLIAQRAADTHQGGLWEFPGGKVEAGESVLNALTREFKEEVDLTIQSAKPLMIIEHDYGDKKVLLDVWLSDDFLGQARGIEGQLIQWVAVENLKHYAFPEANQSIITMLESQ